MYMEIKLAFQIVLLVTFHVINAVFTALRNLVWLWTGTRREALRRRETWESTPLHAHKMKILMPYILDILYPIDECNFVMIHDSFVDPKFVLRDDVSLLQVTKDKALFVQQDSSMAPVFAN